MTWLNRDDWDQLRADYGELFDCGGEAIRYVTHGPSETTHPRIMGVLHQALLWFHEGCREDVDPMAIVKFCSSMEALACGKRLKGIQNLIKTRLHIQCEEKFLKDLKELYNAGRSQTVHGSNDRLGHDWSNSRILAEELARLCLTGCLQWAAEHQQADDPKCFARSKA